MDNYRDYFTREELVRTLSKAPYTPGRLGELGLFEPVPLTSTTMAIEEETTDAGKVLSAIARGAPRNRERLEKRKVHTFQTLTYGDQGEIMADTVLNARALGPAGMKRTLEMERQRIVNKLRRTVDLTHESLRMQCLLNPATTEFGTAASGVVIAVQTDTTKTRQEIFNKLMLPIETALDGLTYTGIHVLCSDGYWSDMIENKAVRETYLNWQAAAELRNDPRMMFQFGGVTWERYRGTSGVKIPDNEARAIPLGVPETFFMGMAPNNTVESVGNASPGQPYYMGSKPIEDSQGTLGFEISIQSHVRMICGRPKVIIPIAKA